VALASALMTLVLASKQCLTDRLNGADRWFDRCDGSVLGVVVWTGWLSSCASRDVVSIAWITANRSQSSLEGLKTSVLPAAAGK